MSLTKELFENIAVVSSPIPKLVITIPARGPHSAVSFDHHAVLVTVTCRYTPYFTWIQKYERTYIDDDNATLGKRLAEFNQYMH